MVRVVKKAHERRAEILAVAGQLFAAQGYGATSVDQIVQTAAIAKGTFYYYFASKEAVLEALATDLVETVAEAMQTVADDPHLGAVDKLCGLIRAMNGAEEHGQAVVADMHQPDNRELHERNNIAIVRLIGPVMAAVVEQGCREGVFAVEDPLATVQFVLAGSLFLFGHGIFAWTAQEEAARRLAMVRLIERAFGAEPGSLAIKLAQTLEDNSHA